MKLRYFAAVVELDKSSETNRRRLRANVSAPLTLLVSAIDEGLDALRWGGVLPHNGKTLASLREGAINEFRAASGQLVPLVELRTPRTGTMVGVQVSFGHIEFGPRNWVPP